MNKTQLLSDTENLCISRKSHKYNETEMLLGTAMMEH